MDRLIKLFFALCLFSLSASAQNYTDTTVDKGGGLLPVYKVLIGTTEQLRANTNPTYLTAQTTDKGGGIWVYFNNGTGKVDDTATCIKDVRGGAFERIRDKKKIQLEWFGTRSNWLGTLNRCIDSGWTIVCEKNATYEYQGTPTASDKSLYIEGNNATFKQKQTSGQTPALKQINSQTTSYNVDSISFSSSNNGITTLVSYGTSFEAGDVLKLYSGDTIKTDKITYESVLYRGEDLIAIKIENRSGNQKLYFQGRLFFEYTQGIKIAKRPTYTADIRNLNITNDAVGPAIELQRTFAPYVFDIKTKFLSQPAVNVFGCYLPKIDKIFVNVVEDAVAGIGKAGSIGYGVNASGNFGLIFTNSTIVGVRHAYTSTITTASAGDWLLAGSERSALIDNNTATNCQIPWDTHATGSNIIFSNNITDNCSIAFQVRTGSVSILTNTITNTDRGIYTYSSGCEGLIVKGNTGNVRIEILYVAPASGADTAKVGKVVMKNNNMTSYGTWLTGNRCIIESGDNTYTLYPNASSSLCAGNIYKFISNNDKIVQGNSTQSQWMFNMETRSTVALTNITMDSTRFTYFWRNSNTGNNNQLVVDGVTINSNNSNINAASAFNAVHSSAAATMSLARISNVRVNGTTQSASSYAEVAFSSGYAINNYIQYKADESVTITLTGGTTYDLSGYSFTTDVANGLNLTIINKGSGSITMPPLSGVSPVLASNRAIKLTKTSTGWLYQPVDVPESATVEVGNVE
ncbi:MAG: hypothetical protein QM768_21880 [Agriterribacter sp.]